MEIDVIHVLLFIFFWVLFVRYFLPIILLGVLLYTKIILDIVSQITTGKPFEV